MTGLGLSADEDAPPRRRREDVDETGMRVKWSVVVQIVAWIVLAVGIYTAVIQRVTVVETRVDSLRSDVIEMKADIKTLLTRKP